MSRVRAILALLALFPLTGCLFRSHRVESRLSTAPVKEATLAELVDRINIEAAKIQTLNATVDIATSVGGWKKGKITEYQDIRGYVLVRKPALLRMIGLFPIVRNRAFDMVSDGEGFRLSIPPKNKFITGRNEVTRPSQQPLENLRPQHIFDALLLREIDVQNEIALLENSTEAVRDPKTKKEVEQPTYVIIVARRGGHGWYLSRKIIFSRTDLQPHRQIVYDKNGYVATDADYENFTTFNGLSFPASIHIWRPQEEYSIGLKILKMQLNQALTDEQFVVEQPPGSQLVRLDAPSESSASGGNGVKQP